jgi:hypothetical protein
LRDTEIMGFTGVERVQAALEHREADRIPFDIRGAAVNELKVPKVN